MTPTLRISSGLRPLPAGVVRLFPATHEVLLHDPRRGAIRTLGGAVGEVRVARVVSTGHDIALTEADHVTVVAPHAGRIDVRLAQGDRRAAPGGAVILSPGSRITRVTPERLDAAYAAAVLLVPLRVLAEAGARADPENGARLGDAGFARSWAPGEAGRGAAERLVRRLIDLDGLVNGAALAPMVPPLAARRLVDALVEALAELGVDAPLEHVRRIDARRVRVAEEFMRLRYGEIASVADVAAAVGVSLRALQLSFEHVRGVSPKRLLAEIRLDAARALLSDPRGDASVTAVAVACGVAHLGRFAAAYRARFGEAPSATLARAGRDAGARG